MSGLVISTNQRPAFQPCDSAMSAQLGVIRLFTQVVAGYTVFAEDLQLKARITAD